MTALEISMIVGILILFVFTIVVFLDKGFFKRKIERVQLGMTGEQIQNEIGLKIRPVEIRRDGYTAIVFSSTRLFKYHFDFENGILVRKLPF